MIIAIIYSDDIAVITR